MNQKRSFFERLTGAVKLEDELDSSVEVIPRSESRANIFEEEEEDAQLSVDVYQTPSEIVVKTMVAGVKPEDLNIAITRDMVTIKGSRETVREISEDNYFHRELYWGSFTRTILLPAEVEVEESEAVEKHGLLTIRLPRIDKDRTQNLKVKSV